MVRIRWPTGSCSASSQPSRRTFTTARQDQPFHIDHVFAPSAWADGAAVESGDFDTWVAIRVAATTSR
ncbi:hypothetical protein IN07_16515 [Modestobacter caceresii]|uniref:Uncharacterized protein n=1 Tax=Modestobacter caceresii TaxID=1522368 RepID=A0A098Y5D3_9ACTN|nr:hypothetical protein IN07_16515 [Modestobacter caceresii]